MKTTSNITPYTPVQYSRLECRIFNLISKRRIQFNLDVGKEKVSVILTFDGTAFPYGGMKNLPRADLAFEAKNELWQISFQKTRFMYELIERADSSGFFTDTAPESLPQEVLWAVVEAFMGESLGRLEAMVKSPVKIAAPVQPAPLDCFNIPFEITYGEKMEKRTSAFFQIPFRQTSVDLLETVLAGFPLHDRGSDAVSGLKKSIFFQAGSVVLTVDEISTLEKGDVLIPDIWYPKENAMGLSIPPRRFMCDYDKETLSVGIRIKNGSGTELQGKTQSLVNQIEKLEKKKMTQEDVIVETDGVNEVKSLDLTLVFEIGRITMTIAEIGQLTQGEVIELPRRLEAGVPVDIKVNDQLIARGKIVGIGDGMGVQITQQAPAKA